MTLDEEARVNATMAALIESRLGDPSIPPAVLPPGDTIFLLTVMFVDPKGDQNKERKRTWGWFKTLKDAVTSAALNDADIYEYGYYNLTVIEEMPWGSLALAEREWWFDVKFDPDAVPSYTVTPIAKPECFAHTASFGMG